MNAREQPERLQAVRRELDPESKIIVTEDDFWAVLRLPEQTLGAGMALLTSSLDKSYLKVKLATSCLPMCLSLLTVWAVWTVTGTEVVEIRVCDSLGSCEPLLRHRGILILLCM